MFLSDWWVSFLLLLFLIFSIVVKKKIGLVCSISFGINRLPLQLKSIFAYVYKQHIATTTTPELHPSRDTPAVSSEL